MENIDNQAQNEFHPFLFSEECLLCLQNKIPHKSHFIDKK